MLHQGRTIPSHYPKPHLTLPLARTCLASIQAENKDLMYLFPKLTRQLESSVSFSGASGCWLCSRAGRADYISERVSSDSGADVGLQGVLQYPSQSHNAVSTPLDARPCAARPTTWPFVVSSSPSTPP